MGICVRHPKRVGRHPGSRIELGRAATHGVVLIDRMRAKGGRLRDTISLRRQRWGLYGFLSRCSFLGSRLIASPFAVTVRPPQQCSPPIRARPLSYGRYRSLHHRCHEVWTMGSREMPLAEQ